MRFRLLGATLGAVLMMSVVPFATAKTNERVLPGDRAECAAAIAARPELAAQPCVITIRSSRAIDGGPVPFAAEGSTQYDWFSVQSINWQVKISFEVEYDWGNSIRLRWINCTVPYAIGVDVDITWCGAYRGDICNIDVGSNWKVSFLYKGFPLSATYWAREWRNCRGGWGAVRYGRG